MVAYERPSLRGTSSGQKSGNGKTYQLVFNRVCTCMRNDSPLDLQDADLLRRRTKCSEDVLSLQHCRWGVLSRYEPFRLCLRSWWVLCTGQDYLTCSPSVWTHRTYCYCCLSVFLPSCQSCSLSLLPGLDRAVLRYAKSMQFSVIYHRTPGHSSLLARGRRLFLCNDKNAHVVQPGIDVARRTLLECIPSFSR